MVHAHHSASEHTAEQTSSPASQNHDKHAGHVTEDFLRRFLICLVVTVPVLLFSETVQGWFDFSMPSFRGDQLIAPVLGTFIFIYGGRVFLQGGWNEIQDRTPGMMLLISLAIIVAYAASLATSLGLLDLEFWWELALLIDVMLLGHWLEMRAIGRTRNALEALGALLPDMAERLTADGSQSVPVGDLRKGDRVLVRPGASVPADGFVVKGDAQVDESMLTGESRLLDRTEGDHVVAGSIIAGSSVQVEVSAVGNDTALAGIGRMIERAQESRGRAQELADRFAAVLFYVAVGAGGLTFLIWLALGEIDQAITRTVTVLVISCPHALGLAIPLVVAISTSVAAQQGILVKDRLALEEMREVDTVMFDKTGTLTHGAHVVTAIAALNGDEAGLISLAAAVEAESEHPMARAIVSEAQARGITPENADRFQAHAGLGVSGYVGQEDVAIGGPRLLAERGVEPTGDLAETTALWADRGATVLHLLVNGAIIGAIALEDEIRAESTQAVNDLHDRNIRVVMITGDSQTVADAVAADLGIDEVFAEVLPEDKDRAVAEIQQRGDRVVMVGDGVNDAPALARADVGIAIGAGTDVAIESAGIVLVSNDPRSVTGVIDLSKATYRKMIQNLGWAVGYNVIAIPLAAGLLAPIGIVVNPAVGAILMSASTIVVAINALLLRKLDLRPSG